MVPLIIIGAGLGLLALNQMQPAQASEPGELTVSNAGIFRNPNYDINDVAPHDQKGLFKNDFDDEFQMASQKTGVPFALIKAHAIAESSLKPAASRMEPNGKVSYGLMQILWWPNSQRFQDWGYDDDWIGDGSKLYDPTVNAYIGAMIIQDNLDRLGNLDDAINAYNTGVRVSVRVAPANYVQKVKNYYQQILGGSIT